MQEKLSNLLFYTLYQVLDIIGISAGLWLALISTQKISNAETLFFYLLLGIHGILAYWLTAHLKQLYRSWRGIPVSEEFTLVLETWLIAVGALLAGLFVLKISAAYSRSVLIIWFCCTPMILFVLRYSVDRLVKYYRIQGRNRRKIVLVGANAGGYAFARRLLRHPNIGMDVVGFFDDQQTESADPRWPILGNFDALLDVARRQVYDRIYLTLPLREEEKIARLLEQLSDTYTPVYYVMDNDIFNMLHARWESIGATYTLSIFENPFLGWNGFLKRMEDFVLASIILALIAFPMLIIAILIRINSPGPALFRQKRYGVDGHEIVVWKFRTMHVCEQSDNFQQATKNDSRVTRLGAFLRKTSMDELPQFINVLQGHMSIVGPRPHVMKMDDEFRRKISGYILRYRVKPGITGLAQVEGWRGETDTDYKMEKRVEHDLQYIKNWSLWLDIKIILLTIVRAFFHRNAY